MSTKLNFLQKIFVILCCVISVFPVLYIFSNSFMSPEEINNRYSSEITEANQDAYSSNNMHFVEPSLLPSDPTLSQFDNLLFRNPDYLRYFWNSVILIVPILIGQMIFAPMAAYGFEMWKNKHKEIIFFMYVVIMLMPMQLLLVPNFIVGQWLGINESYLIIILPAMFHPLGVFLIRQQIKAFPRDAFEAARLDGASEFQIYRKIMMPNMSSVIAAMSILLFADNWNMVDQAVVFIQNTFEMPMSVYLNQVATANPTMFFSVSSFFVFPAIILFLYGQDYLVKGISLSQLRN